MKLEGAKLKDRYIIEKELGRGGLGIVYLAHDTLLSRPVVIKTIRAMPEGTFDDPQRRQAFDKEISALSKVTHPAVVGIFDVGEITEGKPFLVMEYVQGETLRRAIHSRRMPLPRAANIVRQISSALSAAHDVGVTHRDIKPENVMLQTLKSGEEIVKLIDFGIAAVKDLQDKVDRTTTVVGTMPYMAPEHLHGRPKSASDIWALGVIAYEMVTGQLPFSAVNVLELVDLQRAGVSTLPKALCPQLPAAAQAVILKALSYDAASRYEHAFEMGKEFMQAISELDDLTEEITLPMDESTKDAETMGETPQDGHVLFMDLVGYSQLPTEQQVSLIRKLSEIVRNTDGFQHAQDAGQLISLHTGDGMALVFFQNPLAPAQSALEIAEELKSHPEIKLRMGLHSGPVYRVLDINNNPNVAGPGINLAQRVMDSGDAGHILVSRNVADNLLQFRDWREHLHDLGQHEVKHGVRIQMFNLCKGGLGCPDWPKKLIAPSIGEAKPLALPITELLQRCRVLFEELSEFRNPESLRPLFRVPPLDSYARCVSNAAGIEFDQLIDCLYRSGRTYRGQALVDLLDMLASRYKDELWGNTCEGLRDSLKQSLQAPTSGV